MSTNNTTPRTTSAPDINASLINARSIRNKVTDVISFLSHNDIDSLFITETWLMHNDSPIIASLNTPPYLLSNLPRNSSNPGGGIGIIYKSTLKLSDVVDLLHTHSESITCSISSPRFQTFNIAIFYRPPSSSLTSFLEEFQTFASQISPNTIVLGDFNVPINLNNSHTAFTDLLSSCNLIQHIKIPTHERGNTLDLLITPKMCKLILSHSIGPLFSDHFAVMFIISNPKPIRPFTTRHICKLHTIYISNFVRYLACIPSSTPSELHNSMLVTLDLHAPVTTKLSILRSDTSWYTSNLLEEKRLLRKLELRYNKNPHLLIPDEYKTLKIKHRKALKLAKVLIFPISLNYPVKIVKPLIVFLHNYLDVR